MSPGFSPADSVTRIMAWVLVALVPGILAQVWFFGSGVLVTLTLASVTAGVAEAVMLRARGYPVRPFLADLSALVTAWLIALSIPPLAPWWLTVTGVLAAIVVAKHLYGGLGQNIFNPAMVGFAVLIVSFPALMSQWPGPLALTGTSPGLVESAAIVFGLVPLPDAVSMATPLDVLRTGLARGLTVDEAMAGAIFDTPAYIVLAVAFWLGGLVLWARRIIDWRAPMAFVAGIVLTAGLLHFYDAGRHASPLFHFFVPSVALAAFFIVTDPVSGATTPRGKLLFGFGAGFLTVVIRTWGAYPDGVAFAILLMNLAVPLIDQYTQPRVYGHGRSDRP